jgi:(4-(4-[2-(gamma-L-glutamylamino)ethyl]phenoxymethyl)furan-2-yl)methanamine synthase
VSEATVGWDIGGAHVKACLFEAGQLVDVVQVPCPLWQGMRHLDDALDAVASRWPALEHARQALTMTGEMTDLFPDREEGVRRIAERLVRRWPRVSCFAGDAGWVEAHQAAREWSRIASANWLATARHAARHLDAGVLVDIGSTTTDLIAFQDGRVLCSARNDAARLATGELVYHGVVRTPLCALAPRIDWRNRAVNVMNEFFATTADVYRLTGELVAAHDQQATADGAAKDADATRRRLARMLGLDARDGSPMEWLALARRWRAAQVEEIGAQLARVLAQHELPDDTAVISAGCGEFLVPDILSIARVQGPRLRYADAVAGVTDALAGWVQVCAPCVAVAALLEAECP